MQKRTSSDQSKTAGLVRETKRVLRRLVKRSAAVLRGDADILREGATSLVRVEWRGGRWWCAWCHRTLKECVARADAKARCREKPAACRRQGSQR